MIRIASMILVILKCHSYALFILTTTPFFHYCEDALYFEIKYYEGLFYTLFRI